MPPPKHHAVSHQNKTAFKHNPNSRLTAKILAIPNCGLCKHCHDIIEWRKQYRKYKPIKTPAKCLQCKQKNVKFAYHQWCHDCAHKAKICPKCLQSRDVIQAPAKPLDEEAITQLLNGAFIKERRRRVIMRKWEAGELNDMEIREMIATFNEEGAAAGGFDLGESDEEGEQSLPSKLAATSLSDTPAPSQSSNQSITQSAAPASDSKQKQEDEDDDDDFDDDDFSDDEEDD